MDARQSDDADGARGPRRGLRLVVPADPRNGRYVRERIEHFARDHAVADADIGDFLLAIGEALANAFEHAQAPPPKVVEANCWIADDDRLIATIDDSGIGFAGPDVAVEPVATPDPLAVRGRGLAIMQRCTDYVAVRNRPGRGTSVLLMRYVRRRRGTRVG